MERTTSVDRSGEVGITRFLRDVPLFHSFDSHDLSELAEVADWHELRDGEHVFRKGDPGDALFIVARGRVVLSCGEDDTTELGCHEVFGEMAILDGQPRSADAVCRGHVDLIIVKSEDLEALLHERPAIGREILRALAHGLRRGIRVYT
jgi:CRP/FNR family transcriptional regulator, cyclic AMP receptor protein